MSLDSNIKRVDCEWKPAAGRLEAAMTLPLRWRSPRRVHVALMDDLFGPDVPFEFVDKVFAVMALCPQHQFQVLTKRPGRMAEYMNEHGSDWDAAIDAIYDPKRRGRFYPAFESHRDEVSGEYSREIKHWPLPNVWLGTSCEDQVAADERIPHLLRCPAAVRFLSCEPLLGPIELAAFLGHVHEDTVGVENQKHTPGPFHDPWHDPLLHWVIVGGESGPKARPCSVNWINSIDTQCHAAKVPLFVKQLGSRPVVTSTPSGEPEPMRLRDRKGGDPAEWPEDLRVRQWPKETP